jgi:hypothetical protein
MPTLAASGLGFRGRRCYHHRRSLCAYRRKVLLLAELVNSGLTDEEEGRPLRPPRVSWSSQPIFGSGISESQLRRRLRLRGRRRSSLYRWRAFAGGSVRHYAALGFYYRRTPTATMISVVPSRCRASQADSQTAIFSLSLLQTTTSPFRRNSSTANVPSSSQPSNSLL